MGLFTKKAAAPYTLYEHSEDWALDANAPEDVAAAYAEYVVAEDEAGAYGELGANHPPEWRSWCERNLAECAECDNPWMLLADGVWACQDCGHSAADDEGDPG